MATTSDCAMILLLGWLLWGGTGHPLAAQTVSVSEWSSEIDHSLESEIAFQSQSSERPDAYIHIYEDIQAQQITEFKVAAPSGDTAQPPAASPVNGTGEPALSMDQEADFLIVNPLKKGAEAISSAPGSDIDFLLMTQVSRAVKPKAYRIASGLTGTDDLESIAFRNPDGTYVLLAVNHSKSPVTLETSWKGRLFTYAQSGRSIALFAWDPKSQMISLFPSEPQISAEGSVSVAAKCSSVSTLGIDLQCNGHALQCSVFPVRFTCNQQQSTATLIITVYPAEENDLNRTKPGFVTITATPDVGEVTRLSLPCCSVRR